MMAPHGAGVSKQPGGGQRRYLPLWLSADEGWMGGGGDISANKSTEAVQEWHGVTLIRGEGAVLLNLLFQTSVILQQ
jgi:hypothetical protein